MKWRQQGCTLYTKSFPAHFPSLFRPTVYLPLRSCLYRALGLLLFCLVILISTGISLTDKCQAFSNGTLIFLFWWDKCFSFSVIISLICWMRICLICIHFIVNLGYLKQGTLHCYTSPQHTHWLVSMSQHHKAYLLCVCCCIKPLFVCECVFVCLWRQQVVVVLGCVHYCLPSFIAAFLTCNHSMLYVSWL